MKKFLIVLFLVFSSSLQAQQKLPFTLEKDWETAGFEGPESVVLDEKNQVLYVSNVNGNATDKDGNGYISKVSLAGKILEKKWVDQLNGPKGLVIHKNKLYATDIDTFVEIDLTTRAKKVYLAEGATFLNDITANNSGEIFATNTFGFSAIYKLSKDKKVALWLKDEALQMPNGIYYSKGEFFIGAWGEGFDSATFETEVKGQMLCINARSKKVRAISNPLGNLDGISQTLHGFLLTDWIAGKLLYNVEGSKEATEVLTLSKGTADTYFDKSTKSLFIPLMLDGKLLKYHFK